MRHLETDKGFLLRLDTGEEIFGSLSTFIEAQRIQAGAVWGIGAGRDFVLGFYDLAAREYVRREVREEMEIVALSGNVALKDGRPFPHLHIVLSGNDFQTIGGHLFEGRVSATCELVIRPLPVAVHRRHDEATGLHLLKL